MQRIKTVVCSLLLLGCQTMPEKPVVEVGALDLVGPPDTWQVLAGLSDGSDPIHHVPIEAYDKATCFKPKEWERLKVYLKLLEEYGNQCKAASEASR